MTTTKQQTTRTIFYLFITLLLLLVISTINSCEAEPISNGPAMAQVEQLNCGFEISEETMRTLHAISKKSKGHIVRSGIVEVPVSLNVVRQDNGSGGITSSDIETQFNSMNLLYADAGIEFVICGDVNYINNSNLYTADSYDQAELRNTYNKDNVVNLYVTGAVLMGSSNTNVCGYAYYPGGLEVSFLAASCFNNGSTLPHEMGHFFGLIHTHGPSNSFNSTEERADGSNGETTGDLILDTPSDPNLSGQVNSSCEYIGDYTDSVGVSHNPDPTNTMSYSLKQCRTYLSPGQLAKINYVLQTSRSNLVCTETVTQNGTEEYPYIIESPLTNSKWYGGEACSSTAVLKHYLVNGDLDLGTHTISLFGMKKLKIKGNVYGESQALLEAKGCAEICVEGTINAPTNTESGGSILELCGTTTPPEPNGTEENPYLIDDLTSNTIYKNGTCETTGDIVYYKKNGDLNLNSFKLRMKGKVKLTVTGNVYGTETAKLVSRDCAEICVTGTINVMTGRPRGGTINDNCGVPLGNINQPIVINQNRPRSGQIKNGNCNNGSTKYYKTFGDLNLNSFSFKAKGKVVLNVNGDVIGTEGAILKAEKCAVINVTGNIQVETSTSSNGIINN